MQCNPGGGGAQLLTPRFLEFPFGGAQKKGLSICCELIPLSTSLEFCLLFSTCHLYPCESWHMLSVFWNQGLKSERSSSLPLPFELYLACSSILTKYNVVQYHNDSSCGYLNSDSVKFTIHFRAHFEYTVATMPRGFSSRKFEHRSSLPGLKFQKSPRQV